MGAAPVPIYVSRGNFPPRYEVPKFLARGGHLCMAMLTITAVDVLHQGKTLFPCLGPQSLGTRLTCTAHRVRTVRSPETQNLNQKHSKNVSAAL